MGDMQMKETVFNLDCKVSIGFSAADLVKDLAPSSLLDLIVAIDAEVGEWALTMLIARRFQAMLIDAPAGEHTMTDDELTAAMARSDKEFISKYEEV